MKTIMNLTNALFILSMISYIVFSILPDGCSGKDLLKMISGLMCITVVVSIVITAFNTDYKKEFKVFDDNYDINSDLNDYITNKLTDALAQQIEDETGDVLKKHGVKQMKLLIFTDKSDGHDIVINKAVFEVYGNNIDCDALKNNLEYIIGIDCMVVIGG